MIEKDEVIKIIEDWGYHVIDKTALLLEIAELPEAAKHTKSGIIKEELLNLIEDWDDNLINQKSLLSEIRKMNMREHLTGS